MRERIGKHKASYTRPTRAVLWTPEVFTETIPLCFQVQRQHKTRTDASVSKNIAG